MSSGTCSEGWVTFFLKDDTLPNIRGIGDPSLITTLLCAYKIPFDFLVGALLKDCFAWWHNFMYWARILSALQYIYSLLIALDARFSLILVFAAIGEILFGLINNRKFLAADQCVCVFFIALHIIKIFYVHLQSITLTKNLKNIFLAKSLSRKLCSQTGSLLRSICLGFPVGSTFSIPEPYFPPSSSQLPTKTHSCDRPAFLEVNSNLEALHTELHNRFWTLFPTSLLYLHPELGCCLLIEFIVNVFCLFRIYFEKLSYVQAYWLCCFRNPPCWHKNSQLLLFQPHAWPSW